MEQHELHVTVNGTSHTLACEPDAPLLDVLRHGLGLSGPRFGCGLGLCGACFVLIDGQPQVVAEHAEQRGIGVAGHGAAGPVHRHVQLVLLHRVIIIIFKRVDRAFPREYAFVCSIWPPSRGSIDG